MYNTIRALIEGGKEFVLFDLETTGFNPKSYNKDGDPRVADMPIQISAIKCYLKVENGKITIREVGAFDRYINIHRPLPPEIVEITGITDVFLKEHGDEEEDVYKCWADFLVNISFVAGYNSNFDISFVDYMAQRYGGEFEPRLNLDVMRMARHFIPKSDIPNHKLGTVAEFYGIDANFHNAMEDVKATKELLEIFINKYVNEDSVYINNFINK